MIDTSRRDGLKPFLRRWPVWALRALLIAICILMLPACIARGAWWGGLDVWDSLSQMWQDFDQIQQADKEGRE